MTQTRPAPGIAALHRRYAAADARAALAEVLAETYARIAEVDDPGIFIALRPLADLLAEAEALPAFDPAAMPLWGVPFAVKDNIDVAGLPTTAACPDFAYAPAADAFVVARLRAAGALVLGKTNLDQFATGLVGVRTPYPVPRNALDADLVPGGSSSGSARGGGAGHRRLRARHRYRRIRPGAGGAERHRRAEAEPRPAQPRRHGAGLPHARHHLGLCRRRGRCLGGGAGGGGVRPGRALFARPPGAGAVAAAASGGRRARRRQPAVLRRQACRRRRSRRRWRS